MYEGGAAAHELGGGDGTVSGGPLKKSLAIQIVKLVPLAELAYECARIIGEPVKGGCGAQGECAVTAGKAITAGCSCHEDLIEEVGVKVAVEAAAPSIAAQVPATKVPAQLASAVRRQIVGGIVPHPQSPSIRRAIAINEVVRAHLTGRPPSGKSVADLNATLRGLGAVRGIGNPDSRLTIVRGMRQFGAADSDGEPSGGDFEQVPEAKKGIATWWGTGVDPGKVPPKAAAKASASGWPPPAAYRPGNWDFDASTYVLAFGDTLSGLAITYLGSPQRWREIWDVQDQQFRFSHSPDKLMAGQKMNMPHEARDMAKAMLADDSANPQPSTIGKKAPIDVAGENPNAPTVSGGEAAAAGSKAKKLLVPVAIGTAVLGGGYLIWKMS